MGMFDSITNAVSDVGDAFTGATKTVAPYAGLIGGALGGPQGYAIGSMLGGALGGNAQQAQSGVAAYGGALNNQAAQRGNTNAALATQFRPVGITNTFGTSNFAFDPNTGQMTSAGYSLSPQLQSSQNTLLGGLSGNLQDTAAIQNLGRQYIAQSPDQAAQDWLKSQYALLQPSREQAWSGVGLKNVNQGTTGLKVAQGGGLGMANPYAQEVANAQALQDLDLAARAQQAGQQRTLFGQGLLSSAYQPYNAALATSGATEALAQQPLTLSSQLAANSATAGARSAPYIQGASVSPAGQLLGGAGMSNLLGQGISAFGNWLGSSPDVTGNTYGDVSNNWVQQQSALMPSNNNFGNPLLAWD